MVARSQQKNVNRVKNFNKRKVFEMDNETFMVCTMGFPKECDIVDKKDLAEHLRRLLFYGIKKHEIYVFDLSRDIIKTLLKMI